MSGHVGDLSEEQESKLQEFKSMINGWMQERINQDGWELTEDQKEMIESDSMCLRFLRARKWNVQNAFKMYTATAQWRKTFQGTGVAAVTEDTVVTELKSKKSFFYNYDKHDRTIVYVRPRLHIPGSASQEEMERFIVWHMETGRKLLKPGIETGLVVYDMQGFGLANMDYMQVKEQIKLLENYYPESLGQTLIVNAPWMFSMCWKVIKMWIDPVAAEKIKFISMAELKDYIDPDNLLKEYGGNDPYEFDYLTKEERKGTDWLPSWEMPWTYEWRENTKKLVDNQVNDTPSSETSA